VRNRRFGVYPADSYLVVWLPGLKQFVRVYYGYGCDSWVVESLDVSRAAVPREG
jgi:hypothetical protein